MPGKGTKNTKKIKKCRNFCQIKSSKVRLRPSPNTPYKMRAWLKQRTQTSGFFLVCAMDNTLKADNYTMHQEEYPIHSQKKFVKYLVQGPGAQCGAKVWTLGEYICTQAIVSRDCKSLLLSSLPLSNSQGQKKSSTMHFSFGF